MIRLLNPGEHVIHVQYETLCKTRSCNTNNLHASYYGTGEIFTSDNGIGACVSHTATNKVVIEKMGNIWLPDKTVSRCVIDDKENNYGIYCVSTAAYVIIPGYYA